MASSLNLNYQITNAPTSDEEPEKIKDDMYLIELEQSTETEFKIPTSIGELKKVYIGDEDKYK